MRKAQIWFTDFMIGILIFVIVIIIYYLYANSTEQDPSQVTTDLVFDAKSISSSLITRGSPEDWNQTDVEIIGLTDGNQRIVQEKLDHLANMSYNQIKTKLHTPYDFYIQLKEKNGSTILIDSQEGIGLAPDSPDNQVAISRIVIYDSKLTTLRISVWQ